MNNCPTELELRLFLQEQLSGLTEPCIDDHIQACFMCQQALAKLTAVAPHINGLFLSLQTSVVPSSLFDDLPELDKYQILEKVGQGGMGDVYRVLDLSLKRELALKTLRKELKDDLSSRRRFLEEASLLAQLQHPGIVPLHELGQLSDERPFFTMKLIRGQTFADFLNQESSSHSLDASLLIFEQICQAVGCAHSHGVIHRDLKPANVMVGEHGEVQLMDWGVATVLEHQELVTSEPINYQTPSSVSQTVSVAGTYCYMSPEQAHGEKSVSVQSDVFSLGAILCELFTGNPPYHSAHTNELREQALHADLTSAFSRLEESSVSPELIQLTKECLSPCPQERPQNADEIVQRLQEHRSQLQQKLQATQISQATAETKAASQRQVRRRTTILALTLLLLLLCGFGAWWIHDQRQARMDQVIENSLTEVQTMRRQAWDAQISSRTDLLEKAFRRSQKTDQLAQGSYASSTMKARAKEELHRSESDWKQALKDREFLAQLSNAHLSEARAASSEGILQKAFQEYGIDLQQMSVQEAFLQLDRCPPALQEEVVFALDRWVWDHRKRKHPPHRWKKLVELADRLSKDERRKEVRHLEITGQLRQEQIIQRLTLALFPMSRLMKRPFGKGGQRLQELANEALESPQVHSSVLFLIHALEELGEKKLAERVLRSSVNKEPDNVLLLHALGHFLGKKSPPQWREAVGAYRAARAIRPELWTMLAFALIKAGEEEESLALCKMLIKKNPQHANYHNGVGTALTYLGRIDEAIVYYRQALKLDPDSAPILNNLANALNKQEKFEEAIQLLRQALEQDSDNAMIHSHLGMNLLRLRRQEEAKTHCLKAVELEPTSGLFHIHLGNVHLIKKNLHLAEQEYQTALRLNPLDPSAHYSLGMIAHECEKYELAKKHYRIALQFRPTMPEAAHNLGEILRLEGKYAEAIYLFRQVLRNYPKRAWTRNNLGLALSAQGQVELAIFQLRKAIELNPGEQIIWNNLILVLKKSGRKVEATSEWFRSWKHVKKIPFGGAGFKDPYWKQSPKKK